MLKLGTDILPQGILTYFIFRASFVATLRSYALALETDQNHDEPLGYLTEVPFLQWVSPQVQLCVLAETWARHNSPTVELATMIDEVVVYSCAEFAATLVEEHSEAIDSLFEEGPRQVKLVPNKYLVSELRALTLGVSSDGDFLLVSQFEDMPPDEARPLKESFALKEERIEQLFDLLGRWHISRDLPRRLSGLLSSQELLELTEYIPTEWLSH